MAEGTILIFFIAVNLFYLEFACYNEFFFFVRDSELLNTIRTIKWFSVFGGFIR